MSTQLYNAGYTYHGSQFVATRLLNNDFLWDRVRVQGGAYGAGCGFDRQHGTLVFTSYRDPRTVETLTCYRKSAHWLQQLTMNVSDVEQTVIGALGAMDPVRLPETEGHSALIRHLIGTTPEKRQQVRDEIRSTTLCQLKAFGRVMETALEREIRICILGSREGIEAVQPALTMRESLLEL